MKKYIITLLVFLFLSINMQAQSVDFDPDHGQVFVCFGTNSQVSVSIFWSCQETPYPPAYSAASYVELTAEGQTYTSNWHNTTIEDNIPTSMLLSSGTHTWTIKLYERFLGLNYFQKTAETTHTFYVKYTLNAANNFSGGSINLEGSTVTAGTSNASVKKIVGENVSVGAIDQNDGNGYDRIWNTSGTNNSNWLKGGNQLSNSRNYSYTVASGDNGIFLVADLKKIYNATFQNSFTGGTITVAGNSSSAPATTQVVEGNTVTATAQQFYENLNSGGLDYIFSSWDGGSTSLSKTFTVNSTETHTASYTRRANTSLCFEFSFANVAIGNDIQLTWAEHPNTNVTQYKIWRRVKNGSEGYIGTVNRGTTSFTDYEYQYASESDPDKETLYYNVYVYCSLDGGTWNGDGMKLVTGEGEGLMKENLAAHTNITLPTEYKIDNYPNPFNPTTTINFQLPEAGMVTLRVYDILGQEVATLVNEMKQAGYYSATFDASKLTSGIYISTIQTNNFSQSKKMLMIK